MASRNKILSRYAALGLRRACELIAASATASSAPPAAAATLAVSALGSRLRCPSVLRYALELWLLSSSEVEQRHVLRPVGVTYGEVEHFAAMTRAWRTECIAAEIADAARKKAKKVEAKRLAKEKAAAAAAAAAESTTGGMPAMPTLAPPPKLKKKKKKKKKKQANKNTVAAGETAATTDGAAAAIAAYDALGVRASTTIKNRHEMPLRVARELAAALVAALPQDHPLAVDAAAVVDAAASSGGSDELLSFEVAFDEDGPSDAAAWRCAVSAAARDATAAEQHAALRLDEARTSLAAEVDAAVAASLLTPREARATHVRLALAATRAAATRWGSATWAWPERIREKSMVETIVPDPDSDGGKRVVIARKWVALKSAKRQAEHCVALALKLRPELTVDPDADKAMREAELDTTVFTRSAVRVDLKKHEAREGLERMLQYIDESGIPAAETLVAFDFDLTLKAPAEDGSGIDGACVRGGEATLELLAALRARGVTLVVVTAAKVSPTNWNTICNTRATQLGLVEFFGDARGGAWEGRGEGENDLQAPPPDVAAAINEKTMSDAEQLEAQLIAFRTLRIRLNDVSEDVGVYDERSWCDATEDGGCVYIAGRGFILADYNKPHAVRAYCARWASPPITPRHVLFVDDFVVNARNFGAYFAEQKNLCEGSARTVRAMAQLERVTSIWWSAEALFKAKRTGGEASSKSSASGEVRHAVAEFEAGELSL